jgi:hypothetical protein
MASKRSPQQLLDDHLHDVREVLAIPKMIRGHNDKILQITKTAIIFITASFEHFVETLAEDAFQFLLQHSKEPADIPERIRNLVAARYAKEAAPQFVWRFAGDGWRTVLQQYQDEVVRKHIGSFSNPTIDNIDALFAELIGLKHVSRRWSYKPGRYQAVRIYQQFLQDRHAIVHRNQDPKAPSIFYARRYLELVETIARQTIAAVDEHLGKLTARSARVHGGL